MDLLEKVINLNIKGIIINFFNNFFGVVYFEEMLKCLLDLLRKKFKEYNKILYFIFDELYREIVYDEIKVFYVLVLYENIIICYLYSKLFFFLGERIGYILVFDEVESFKDVYIVVCGVGCLFGYVCVLSLF